MIFFLQQVFAPYITATCWMCIIFEADYLSVLFFLVLATSVRLESLIWTIVTRDSRDLDLTRATLRWAVFYIEKFRFTTQPFGLHVGCCVDTWAELGLRFWAVYGVRCWPGWPNCVKKYCRARKNSCSVDSSVWDFILSFQSIFYYKTDIFVRCH